ncbi:MAG: hypothetical protein Q8912_14970 [Bacillota bacterium]|nr:hypothetical protein [Bacillota bacterium]
MQLRGFKNFKNQNMQQFMGQNPFPMRGLERFMQKRGMNSPVFPGGGFQGTSQQGNSGDLANTLNVQAPPKKSGGIKEFLSKFSRKPK